MNLKERRAEAVEVISTALDILGPNFNHPKAMTMLLAIGFQESAFLHTHQIGGPAHGWWQFESGGGVLGVMTHHQTQRRARDIIVNRYGLPFERAEIFAQIEQDQILAAIFARLLLWTDPAPIPTEQAEAWNVYDRTWRPGKPHPERWPASWAFAMNKIEDEPIS